jgi:hypothetical protein
MPYRSFWCVPERLLVETDRFGAMQVGGGGSWRKGQHHSENQSRSPRPGAKAVLRAAIVLWPRPKSRPRRISSGSR